MKELDCDFGRLPNVFDVIGKINAFIMRLRFWKIEVVVTFDVKNIFQHDNPRNSAATIAQAKWTAKVVVLFVVMLLLLGGLLREIFGLKSFLLGQIIAGHDEQRHHVKSQYVCQVFHNYWQM